jgi:hypothetical protein
MPTISLTCANPPHEGTTWQLDLAEAEVRLVDHQGAQAAHFSRRQADRKLVLPSSWEGVPRLGVASDAGAMLWFQVDPEQMKQIKAYLNTALSLTGPEAKQALQTRARWSLLLGSFAAVLGFGLLIVNLANPPEADATLRYILIIALVAYGVIEVVRGAVNMARAKQVK